MLLERKQLTSGTTWHAAGLIGQLRQSMNMTQLARYTARAVSRPRGRDRPGDGLSANAARCLWRRRRDAWRSSRATPPWPRCSACPSMSWAAGEIRCAVSARQSRGCDRRHSHPERRLCERGRYHAGARQGRPQPRRADFSGPQGDRHPPRWTARAAACRPTQGRIDADYVVLCGGMWTRDLAASIGVTVPLHACEHYYVLFQDVPGLDPDMPVLRDYDHCSYFKYDAGKLLVGAFEPHARPWGARGDPRGFFLRRDRRRFRSLRACAARCHAPHPGARAGRAFRSSSAARRASRRTCAITWASRPSSRTASSPPA